jgi:hypothetical protein
MSALQVYLVHQNRMRKIFKSPPLDLTNAKDRQDLARNIDCQLSPENLSCDGELPASAVRSKYRQLLAVAQELQALDPNVRFYEL